MTQKPDIERVTRAIIRADVERIRAMGGYYNEKYYKDELERRLGQARGVLCLGAAAIAAMVNDVDDFYLEDRI